MMSKNSLIKGIVITVILITTQTIYATNVKRIVAETDDGLTITVWTQESVIKLNQDMIFLYAVKNSGKKPIYLVTERSPEIFVESYIINIGSPFPASGVNTPLIKLNYHEVKQGETFNGTIIVPFDKFKLDKLWKVNFGFAYVLDKSGLDRELESYKDPQSLIGEFSQRVITTDLGSLEISVRK